MLNASTCNSGSLGAKAGISCSNQWHSSTTANTGNTQSENPAFHANQVNKDATSTNEVPNVSNEQAFAINEDVHALIESVYVTNEDIHAPNEDVLEPNEDENAFNESALATKEGVHAIKEVIHSPANTDIKTADRENKMSKVSLKPETRFWKSSLRKMKPCASQLPGKVSKLMYKATALSSGQPTIQHAYIRGAQSCFQMLAGMSSFLTYVSTHRSLPHYGANHQRTSHPHRWHA